MGLREIVSGMNDKELSEKLVETYKLFDKDTKKDRQLAVKIFQKISDLYPENVQSKHALGVAYETGRGIDIDLEKAKEFYRTASFLGSVISKQSLAYILLNEEDKEAVDLLESIVSNSKLQMVEAKLNATSMLASLYWNGKLVKRSKKRAIELYELCYQYKHTIGMLNYAFILVTESKTNTKHVGKAYDICKVIISQDVDDSIKQEAVKIMSVIDASLKVNLAKGLQLITGTEQVEKNIELGQKLLEFASDSGSAEASFYLGRLYYIGKDIKKDFDKAFKYFEISYDRGFKEALPFFEVLRRAGTVSENVMKNEKIAYENYSKIKDSNQYHVMFDYVLFWSKSSMKNPHEVYRVNELAKILAKNSPEKKYKEFARDLHKSINEFIENAYTDALAFLGVIDGLDTNPTLGLDLLKTVSIQGHTEAPCHLGKHYLINENNPKKALEYLKIAKERGSIDADYFLGVIYSQENGSEKDSAKAIECLEAVVKRKNRKTDSEEYEYKTSLELLATVYGRDLGDGKNAIKYWKKSAKLDSASAQYNLAFLYHEGSLIPKDGQEALFWAIKSKENGNENAEKLIQIITNDII